MPDENVSLAQIYQEMIDAGLVAPVEEVGRFSYPTMRKRVPSIATYGVYDTRGLEESIRAQLERGFRRNQR